MKLTHVQRILSLILVLILVFAYTSVAEAPEADFYEAPIPEIEVQLGDTSMEDSIPDEEYLGDDAAVLAPEIIAQDNPASDGDLIPQSIHVTPMSLVPFALTQNATATLNVGDQIQISVDGFEVKSWKSSKPKVAAVNEAGLVTANAKGKAKIKVTTTAKKKFTLSLTVVDPYEPSGVALAQGNEVTIDVGSTLALTPALAPDTARTTFTWKSSKGKVATVDANGVISALKEGKAKIAVSTANKKKATINVTVVDPYKPASVGFAEGSEISISIGQAYQLNPTLNPASARTTYTWKSGKKKIVSVDANGVVTGIKAGTAKITATTSNKKKATIVVHVVEAPAPAPEPEPSSPPTPVTKKYHVLDFLDKTVTSVNNIIPQKLTYLGNGIYANDYVGVALDSSGKINWVAITVAGPYHLFNILPGDSISSATTMLYNMNFSKLKNTSDGIMFGYKGNTAITVLLTPSGNTIKQLCIGMS